MKQTDVLISQIQGQLNAVSDLIRTIKETHSSYIVKLVVTNQKDKALKLIEESLSDKNYLGESFKHLIADTIVADISESIENFILD